MEPNQRWNSGIFSFTQDGLIAMSGTNGQQKWIVKDTEGKIYGPFTTSQVLAEIDKGSFLGTEQIATYPGGRWSSMSKSPEFSDRLLDVLVAEAKPTVREEKAVPGPGKKEPPASDKPSEKQIESPQAHSPRPGERKSQAPADAVEGSKRAPSPSTKSVESSASSGTKATKGRPKANTVADAPVIELTDLKALERKEKLKDKRVPLIFIGIALALVAGAVLLPDESVKDNGSRVRLLAPRKGQQEIGETKIREKFKRALISFQTDTFSGYQKAQNELVEIVEGASNKPEGALNKAEWLSVLCLTYRELWAFSYQDSIDMKTVSNVMQDAKRLDPGGRHGATCEIVHLMLSGRYRDAQGLTESMLVEDGQTPVMFEIRGDIYAYLNDHANAASYFNQARVLWPAWQKPAVQEARSRAAIKEYPAAIQLYSGVIKGVPSHGVAKVELGLLEALQFGQLDRGFALLNTALEGKEKLAQPIEADALFGIAQIYMRRNQKQKALEYARRAYAIHSGHLGAKRLVLELAGSGKELPQVDPRGLMFLGDQYVRAGDCVAAQAEFKAAFEAEPKNGIAAMKAGKCLWDLNQTTEAIDWMRKAIVADPKLTPAYVTLADYYAQRFDYTSAVQVLRKIQQLQPESYEVYRGFAIVELHRNNFQGAAGFALRAQKIYETDIETIIIMAKAQLGLQNFQEAQRYADRAIELDFNNTEAHSLRAKVEAGMHGVDQGAAYIQKLINRYVISKGQQVPQAAIDFRVTLGEIYMQDERFIAAEEAFRQAISLEPNNKRALLNLGKALQAQNMPSQALEVFLKAAVLDPSDADPIFFSGQLYFEVGKPDEALRQFERVLKINPRYPRGHVSLGRVFLRKGESNKALEEAMQERVHNPELTDSNLLAADAYFALKQYSNCAAELQLASKKVRTAFVLVRMARCYRLAGALDSAQSLLRQVETLESGNPDLYKEQGAIYHMKAMADEAIAAYDTYLKLVPSAPDKAEIEMRKQKVQAGDLEVGE